MRFNALKHRLYASSIAASLLTSVLLPATALASGNATLEFRPHCEGDGEIENLFGGPMPDADGIMKQTEGTCRTFEVRDPSSLQTDMLKIGDTLDIDIVVNNPDGRPVNRFRAWIAYDPSVLEGMDIQASPLFPVPTPGESGFTAADGTLKLSGTSTTPVSEQRFSIARVRFRILKDSLDGTPLIFTETTGGIDAKSGVFEGAVPSEQNVLSMTVGSLYVRLAGTIATTSAASSIGMPMGKTQTTATSEATVPSSAAPMSSMASFSSTPSVTSKAFSLLQVLGLRVTTEGSSIFLAWDVLPSSELSGYNVYYGTVSGRYIQRRTVDKAANSLTIRALPVGTTYYFAVRAYNAAGEETVFSQEVGVSVGNPKTSTSPLNANSLPTKTPSTGGQVAGETGTTSTLLVLFLTCAAVGTLIAVRRQIHTSSGS